MQAKPRIEHGSALPSLAVLGILIFLFSIPAEAGLVDPLEGFPNVFHERISCFGGFSPCTIIDEFINDETPEDIMVDYIGGSGEGAFQFVARALSSATPSGPFKSPFGSVETSAINANGDAQVVIRYPFVVQGPEVAGGVLVSITAQGQASVSGSGASDAGEAFAEALLMDGTGTFERASACLNGGFSGCTGPATGAFSITWSVTMDPFSGDLDSSWDVLYIQLSALAFSSGEGAEGQAVIDPVIVVDPTFPNADQYNILLPEGLVNGGAIPIPAVGAVARIAFMFLVVLVGVIRLKAPRRNR